MSDSDGGKGHLHDGENPGSRSAADNVEPGGRALRLLKERPWDDDNACDWVGDGWCAFVVANYDASGSNSGGGSSIGEKHREEERQQ